MDLIIGTGIAHMIPTTKKKSQQGGETVDSSLRAGRATLKILDFKSAQLNTIKLPLLRIEKGEFSMLQKFRTDTKGFTLIELMIVIAIIGILAAIAIPNFIAYRNKSFCSAVEGDAGGIAAAIADYFAIPTHTATPAVTDLNDGRGFTFTREGLATANTGTVDTTSDPNINITITVTDGSGRCPESYRSASPFSATDRRSGWDAPVAGTPGVYVKYISF